MKIERLLVAVDFSDTSTAAARYAVEHFAPGVEVVLLHVIDPPARPSFAHDVLPSEEALEAMAREFAAKRFLEIASSLPHGIRSRVEVRVGKPDELIGSTAKDVDASIVVIGPHGDRPRPWRFLGTTADRVVRTSPVPVLVATAPTPHPPRRILVPVDDDSAASPVLAWTRDLSGQFDADVTLLHVWSNAVYSHVASMSYAETRTEADARREIESELRGVAQHWLDHVARTGLARERVTSTVAWGKTADVVLETAELSGAELIVLGRNGSGLVSGALLGRTTATVLHGAQCPVLVVTKASGA